MATNSITGMIKVFKQNFLVTNSITYTASSGQGSASSVADFDRSTYWVSSGSDDTTTETFDVTFGASVTIDRIVLLNMNFKDYSVQYWTGAAYTDFTNVFSEKDDTAVTGISETANTDNSRYYEFDSISTTKVRISATKTITANEEKQLTELYIGVEVGTFIDDLTSDPNTFEPILSNTRSIYITKSNGGVVKYEKGDKYSVKVDINQLWETADQDIINTMYDDGQFAIYPCGAVGYTQRGWRLQDFFNVIIRGNLQAEFGIGRVAAIGLNYKFTLLEQ
jgi:hypothetical protein